MLQIYPEKMNAFADKFCHDYIVTTLPKFVLGTNEFAKSIADCIQIDGYIDDYTSDIEYYGVKIVRMHEVPSNALVVSAVLGKPFLARKALDNFQFTYLDYFAFFKYSSLPLKQVMFWDNFKEDFEQNKARFEEVFNKLEDEISKEIFEKIVNFKLSYDLRYIENFKENEINQYFEKFLQLKEKGETFVDIGGFDGNTTIQFIKQCPEYNSVFIFEPVLDNFIKIQEKLKTNDNVHILPIGISNEKKTLCFDINGSSSAISTTGNSTIEVDLLDTIVKEPVTFIKMDIEGSEYEAIEGARQTILKYHPRLAISAYHKYNDLWKIPELILSMRDDYTIYLRHYTEGINETVLFFIPSATNL